MNIYDACFRITFFAVLIGCILTLRLLRFAKVFVLQKLPINRSLNRTKFGFVPK